MQEQNQILKEKFTFLIRSEIVEQIQMIDKIEITSFFKGNYGYEVDLIVELYTYGDTDSIIKSLLLCEKEFFDFFSKFVHEKTDSASSKIKVVEGNTVNVYPSVNEIKMDNVNDRLTMKWYINVEYGNF